MRSDRPSATALLIAKSQLVLAHDPALSWAVGPERARIYRACVSAALGRAWSPTALRRAGYAIAERLSVPGIYLHYALRKLEIARIVDALIREHPALAEKGLTHHAGHGIGLRAHEMPDLNPERGGKLEVGQIITCEPGGYPDAARGGVRLENMYLITENGAENLSVFPMTLR